MPYRSAIESYLIKRRRAFKRGAELRLEVDAWLTQHETTPVTLRDLIMFEAFTGEREMAFAELQRAEALLLLQLKAQIAPLAPPIPSTTPEAPIP
jgi:hypothetical protein